jgi:protein-disulfide isomerase
MSKRKKRKASRKHRPTQKAKLKKQQLEEEIKLETVRLEEEKKIIENAPETITQDQQIEKALQSKSETPKEKEIDNTISEETKESEKIDLIKKDEKELSRIIDDIEDVEDEVVENKSQDVDDDEDSSADCKELQKKNKTLIAVIIVLAGLAVGSFFVDVAQLFSERGFSARALQDAQVVEYDGSTWVRYDDPKIVVDVFTADDCEDCMTDEVLVRLRSLIPTLEAHYVNVRTQEGQEYAKENEIKYIPSFVFSDTVINSDFYQGAAILFEDAPNDKYYLEATKVGVPIGEYLESPADEGGIVFGPEDAQKSAVVFLDLTCKNCNTAYNVSKKISQENDDVKVVVKLAPDEEENKYAKKVAIATECANKQGKFDEYAMLMLNNQKEIDDSKDITTTLIKYAPKAELDKEEFEKCLDSKDVREVIEKNILEASQFGVTSLPEAFINGQPSAGPMTYDNLVEQLES